MSERMAGKRVLVTGASRGIGRAVARQFASEGARVCVHYGSNEEAARSVIGELHGEGHCMGEADLTDRHAVRELVKRTAQELGGVDVLVNNAGVFFDHPVDELEYDDWQNAWDRTLGVNLFGPANLIHQVVPHMREAGGGSIINVSSRGAFRGEPVSPAYGASKAGLNSLSQSLAVSLAKYRIRVIAVAPGFVATDMVRHLLDGPEGERIAAQSPLNRVATPEEIAATITWLATPEAEFLTGGIIDINGASYLRS